MRLGFLWGGSGDSAAIPLKMVNIKGASTVPDGYYFYTYDGAFSFSPSRVAKSAPDTTFTGIVLGSGVGAVSLDDYALQAPFYDGFSYSLVRSTECTDSSGYCFSEFSINLTATKSITIGEVGFAIRGYLLDRTVLDTPLSLSTAQSGCIKYRITNASTFNV